MILLELTPAHGGGAGFAHVLHILVSLDEVAERSVESGVVTVGATVKSVCCMENLVKNITFPKESVVDIGRAPLACMVTKFA